MHKQVINHGGGVLPGKLERNGVSHWVVGLALQVAIVVAPILGSPVAAQALPTRSLTPWSGGRHPHTPRRAPHDVHTGLGGGTLSLDFVQVAGPRFLLRPFAGRPSITVTMGEAVARWQARGEFSEARVGRAIQCGNRAIAVVELLEWDGSAQETWTATALVVSAPLPGEPGVPRIELPIEIAGYATAGATDVRTWNGDIRLTSTCEFVISATAGHAGDGQVAQRRLAGPRGLADWQLIADDGRDCDVDGDYVLRATCNGLMSANSLFSGRGPGRCRPLRMEMAREPGAPTCKWLPAAHSSRRPTANRL